MKYQLPPLPYAYDALEPYLDARTMEIHHTKHHQAYVDKLNKALEGYSDLENRTIEQLLDSNADVPSDIRDAVLNNGGGHWNHSFFWPLMKSPIDGGGGAPVGDLAIAIVKKFRNFEKFKEEFVRVALGRFGSGWVWLISTKTGLKIVDTPNQDSPLMKGIRPILGLDVWEHAYYLKYQNRRAEYIEAWWNVVNWKAAEKNLIA